MQPVAHPGQGSLGEVEIPKSRQIGDSRLVPQIVEKRPIRLQAADVARQASAYLFEPIPVGKTGLADEGRQIKRIFPIALLGLQEPPVFRPITGPLVIGRIEIGRDVFEVKAQIGVEQRFDPLCHKIVRRVVDRQHPCCNPQPLQGSVRGPILHLPHDDLIIPPWDIGRRSDE